MKQLLFSLLIFSISFLSVAQSEQAIALVKEGIALHDNGEYAKAIEKYDAALQEDPSFFDAYYEKSYSLFSLQKLDECIELSKDIIKRFPNNPELKGVYVHYGSALDVKGNSTGAIKIYNEGLKKFPGYFLLHFNKGITYSIMKEYDKATDSYQQALISNPLHASSYLRYAGLLQSSNKIPAMLSLIMHLILEPQSDRSAASHNVLIGLIYANVKKTGENSISIMLSPDMLDSKKSKKQPDNFRTEELLFTFSSALDKDSTLNSVIKTDIEKFDLKLQLLINSLTENNKGFFSERYVPFFKQLKEKEYTLMVSRLVYANKEIEENDDWFADNKEKTDAFYQWLEQYKWPSR